MYIFNRAFWSVLAGLFAVPLAFVPTRAGVEGHFDRTFAVAGHVDLEVVSEAGNILLRTGESGKVEIHAQIVGSNWASSSQDIESRVHAIEANPPIEQSGNSFCVGHFANQDLARDISITYEIVVPIDTRVRSETSTGDQSLEGIHGPLEAATGSGSLRVSKIGGEALLRTGSGDIELRNIQGNVQATTGTGSIRATEIMADLDASPGTGGPTIQIASITSTDATGNVGFAIGPSDLNVEVSTGSGDVDLDGVKAGLQVTTGSGTIRVSGEPVSDWRLHTGTGSIQARFPKITSFELVAHTSSGEIEIGRPITPKGNSTHREFRGQLGRGGPKVDLSTASGNIKIE